MTTDPRDAALQKACPTLAAPRFGALPEMENGQRIVVAANGVFVQMKLDWLDCIVRIADIAPVPPLPYGVVQEHIVFSFGVIPVRLLEEFIAAGRAGLPNEVAGGLLYSRSTKQLRLQIYDAIRASPNRIDYRMPQLQEDETIAIDLHTHGRAPAFWSPTDNADDRGVKVAGVFGHLDQAEPNAAFRLVVNGYYKALRHPWAAAVQPDAQLDAHDRWPILNWLRGARRGTWSM